MNTIEEIVYIIIDMHHWKKQKSYPGELIENFREFLQKEYSGTRYRESAPEYARMNDLLSTKRLVGSSYTLKTRDENVRLILFYCLAFHIRVRLYSARAQLIRACKKVARLN